MAKLDFPASPSPNQIYTANGRSWIWNGISWKTYNALGTISISGGGTGLTFINSANAFLSSNNAGTALTYRTFTAGSGILITVYPSDVVFTSTATGGGSGNVYDGIQGQLGYYYASGTSITGSGTGLTFDLPTNSLYISGNLSLNGSVINGTWAGTALTSKYGGFGSIPTVSKGDILVGSGNTWYNLPYSASDNQVLTVDTAQPFGVKWSNIPPAAASSVAVKPTNDTGTRYLLFVNTSDGSGLALSTDTNLTYDASNNLLSLGTLSGTAISIINGSNYSAFIYSGSANTTYTLPQTTPATGTSVLQSTSGGILSWVAMSSSNSGSATTANNIDLVQTNQNTNHYLTFSNLSSGSGVALSSDSDLTYNPSTNKLSLGNGSLAANGVTIGLSSNTITTSSGNLILNGASGNVQISGNLVIFGDTVSIGSTISTLLDPIFVLGAGLGGTNPTVDDNKDRGVEFRWYSGTAKTGFFGFDDSSGYFTFIPDGLNTNEVFSGAAGTALFTTVIADLTGTATTATYALQSGYAITSGLATTSTYAHQSGYAITSGLATTATYSHQSGYAITSGTATTATYSHQSGYAITSGLATTSNYSHQSGYAITSGLATTSNYSHQSGYAVTSGSATTTDNIKLIFASTSSIHPLVFTPNSSSSGSALSTNSTLVYNPSTDILYSSGISVTANTSSTSTSTGALTISGGVGIGGSLFVGGIGASISGIKILSSVINTGAWAGTAITSAYGGFGSIPIVSKGDILVGAGNTWYNLPYSAADNQVLTIDTSQPFGVKWSAVPPAAASSVAVSPTNDTGNRYLTFVNTSSGSGLALSTDTDLYYNASNNILSVGTLSGSGISIINGSNYSAFIYTGLATTTYVLPASTPATGTSVLQSTSGGVLSWVAPSSGSISGSGTSAYVPLWTNGGIALTDLIISQSATTIDVAGHLKARTKSFLIPHPLDPENMWLEHGSLEGPEHGVYVRGTASGIDEATIYLPDYWDKLVDENYTILITPKVPYTLYVSKQNQISFTIKRAKAWFSRKKNIEFDYIVVAPRNDIKLQLNQPR